MENNIKPPKNSNYAATIVEIKTLVPLEKCDFVQAAIIMGNQVIVSKDIKIGDIGLYFPLECQLSHEYVSNNNLYRKKDLNVDKEKAGYFEENRRIRCVKFRGHKSEGLFMPLSSLDFITNISLNVGTELDELNNIEICRKYIIQHYQSNPTSKIGKKNRIKKKVSKLVDNQFRFHQDTNMLYKNLHMIKPESLISITYKLHGTSGISSRVLCKKHISKIDKFKEWIWNLTYFIPNLFKSTPDQFILDETEYDYLYSSRKVIKNEELNPNTKHYYNEDIWKLADEQIKPFLQKGMSAYYEIVGYVPGGAMIQKGYDYGCEPSTFKVYIYRLTYTNPDGKLFEFSAKQVQDFCKKNGLNAVPQLFYGFAKDFSDERMTEENWQNKLLETLKAKYNEKDCFMCYNKVPEEGIVIRVEGLDFEAYKLKSNAFYEWETKQLDIGEVDIESEN